MCCTAVGATSSESKVLIRISRLRIIHISTAAATTTGMLFSVNNGADPWQKASAETELSFINESETRRVAQQGIQTFQQPATVARRFIHTCICLRVLWYVSFMSFTFRSTWACFSEGTGDALHAWSSKEPPLTLCAGLRPCFGRLTYYSNIQQ